MKPHQQALDIAGDYDNLSDQIQAYLKERGLVAVPKEPTDDMLSAVWSIRQSNGLRVASVCYEAMLAAAPNPFEGEE